MTMSVFLDLSLNYTHSIDINIMTNIDCISKIYSHFNIRTNRSIKDNIIKWFS